MENNNIKSIFFIFLLIISAGCIGAAVYMACANIENWGWFLFAGILIIGGITVKSKDNVTINEEEDD